MSEEIEKQYLVTIDDLVKIVDYCVSMTIAGQGINKDWKPNVLQAIGINGTSITLKPKINLKSYDNTTTRREAVEECMDIVNKKMSSLGWHKYWNDRDIFDAVGCRGDILEDMKGLIN